MPKASSRAPLPTSSSDFALPSSSASSPGASSSSLTLDDPTFLFHRLRRSSFYQKAGYLSDTRLHSPLASSFTLHGRRRSQNSFVTEESESDKDRMMTDSPNSSETHTPPLKVPGNSEEDLNAKAPTRQPPLTPPRKRSSASLDAADMPTIFNRRLSFPLKQPRILNLLAESRPEDTEIKSEAAFQKLVASVSELPLQPRTPRSFVDRGRYPEEVGQEETTREETPSDDEPETEEGPFAFSAPSGTQPINIRRLTHTPSGSIAGSVNGDDTGMSISETSSSFGATAMDVDQPLGSPLLTSIGANSINQWRYTPPPTASAVRSNKRKLDDRFDPYPTSSKRRAVSPSLHHLRDNHQHANSPISRSNGSRLPIAIPVTIPPSAASSATSSPTISSNFSFPRGISITSSPTLRATISMPSPILRPLTRRRDEEEEREIEGAGEAVNGLTIKADTKLAQPDEVVEKQKAPGPLS
ncbi:hypothetical protein CPB84DRAFT_1760258 [Gymnopilus junonius]|uniref:Uncharacterized protein n=1 Tax=Gymnopilus junonius TaxID=109634 RepID=A0A9P5TTT0_GYMJU|nr:hypothetical protein CPB84DRAFT_1760258 [Gymnopilus junonius]